MYVVLLLLVQFVEIIPVKSFSRGECTTDVFSKGGFLNYTAATNIILKLCFKPYIIL